MRVFMQAQHPEDLSAHAEDIACSSVQAARVCCEWGLLSCSVCSSSCPTPGGVCALNALLYRFLVQLLGEAAALRSTQALARRFQEHSMRSSHASLCACMRASHKQCLHSL